MTQLKDIQFTAPVLTGTVVNSGAMYRLESNDVIEVGSPDEPGCYYGLIFYDYSYYTWRFSGVVNFADSAGCAGFADCAGNAYSAECAGYAYFADCAGNAGYADSAGYAGCAGLAYDAYRADCAGYADSAGYAGYTDQLRINYGGCWSARTVHATELSSLPACARVLYFT